MMRRRFLVVDDHDATRNDLSGLLQARGFHVSTASTVTGAVSLLSPLPCCVVLDLMLPDGPGELVLQTVRTRNLPTRVAVWTDCQVAARLETVRKLNPDLLLFKPSPPTEVVKACEKILVQVPQTDAPAAGIPGSQTRRRFQRVPFFVNVTLTTRTEWQTIQARTIDISLGGASLVCASPLWVGQPVSLIFHLGVGGVAHNEGPVNGRVASLRYDDDAIIAGVEFTPVLSDLAVPALVRTIEGI